MKRFSWPLGRIVELFPGKNRKVRAASVRTANRIFTRPLQGTYPLEVIYWDSLPTPETAENEAHLYLEETISAQEIKTKEWKSST
jgi:hypothetical protein